MKSLIKSLMFLMLISIGGLSFADKEIIVGNPWEKAFKIEHWKLIYGINHIDLKGRVKIESGSIDHEFKTLDACEKTATGLNRIIISDYQITNDVRIEKSCLPIYTAIENKADPNKLTED